MAIFNNSNSTPKSGQSDSNTTIITSGSKIKGELELTCNLYIDGELDGAINSTKEINVGKNGNVKGTIFTDRLVVQGYVEGHIDAKVVEIKSQGHVSGEISSNELVIETKAIFEGNSILKESKQPAERKEKLPQLETK